MSEIEKAAIKTYLWWKNRYFAIEGSIEGDNLQEFVAGAPEGGFCDVGKRVGLDETVLSVFDQLQYPEIEVRQLLREGDKVTALQKIREGLNLYQQYLLENLGQDFITNNQEVFLWP